MHDQLGVFCGKMTVTTNEGRVVDVIYLDFSNAYNTISTVFLYPSWDITAWVGRQSDGQIPGWMTGLRGWWIMSHTLP